MKKKKRKIDVCERKREIEMTKKIGVGGIGMGEREESQETNEKKK